MTELNQMPFEKQPETAAMPAMLPDGQFVPLNLPRIYAYSDTRFCCQIRSCNGVPA